MKKFLISFTAIFILATHIFVCAAITYSDITVSNRENLSWDMMNKCADLSADDIGYLVLKSKSDDVFVNYVGDYSGVYSYPLSKDFYVILATKEPCFTLSYHPVSYWQNLCYDDFYVYDNTGKYIATRHDLQGGGNTFAYKDFCFIATNKGVYNSDGDCIFFSTSIPVAQGFYISYKKIIYTLLQSFIFIVPVLIIFLSIRKVIGFVIGNIKGV